ncbi:MAG: nucleotidyl transferase AbiEii/AbiGii toxin family protein [Candidatus Woesearchaeota archaeon]
MTEIPLILRLKKQSHKDIARAQDIIVETLYEIFNKAVLHGGTAIWRCYSGNRFSEDIDALIPKNLEKIEALFRNFEKKGFFIEKKKIGQNSIYSKLKMNRTIVRFEALFKNVKGELKEYETINGILISVYTLLPEDLIKGKVDAYLNRLKIRDIYDIFFLLRFVKNKDLIKKDLERLVRGFKKPIDEKELKVIIIQGIVPKIDEMMDYIKRGI